MKQVAISLHRCCCVYYFQQLIARVGCSRSESLCLTTCSRIIACSLIRLGAPRTILIRISTRSRIYKNWFYKLATKLKYLLVIGFLWEKFASKFIAWNQKRNQLQVFSKLSNNFLDAVLRFVADAQRQERGGTRGDRRAIASNLVTKVTQRAEKRAHVVPECDAADHT